jgi:hypothetical protein
MKEEHSSMAMNAIAHEAFMAGQVVQQVAYEYERPSILLRPRLFIDGNQWCALYGENIQDGVAGFGDTPAKAMRDFDTTFNTRKAVIGVTK